MIELHVVGEMTDREIEAYIDYLQKKHNRKLQWLSIQVVDDEYVDLDYRFVPVSFERIRRITGYLTGDTSTWNDAKQHELEDRVTHGTVLDINER